MSFEDECLYGFKKYEKHFDKICEQSSSVFGHITHSCIIQVHKSGYTYIAGNRPEIEEIYLENENYKSDPIYSYSPDISEGFSLVNGIDDFKYLWGDEEHSIGKLFDTKHGFYYTEKVDNEIYKHYFFASDQRHIYNILIRNLSTIKNFIMHFKELNKDVFKEMEDRKVHMSEHKDTYFNTLKHPFTTCKERLINFLRMFGLLHKYETLTDREFECVKLYCQGQTSKIIGKALDISHRTVESHINSLKEKLEVHSRDELTKKLGDNCN